MPYILSPVIKESTPALWFEEVAYKKENIYSISRSDGPPVNYDSHTLNPHSITHVEAPAHTIENGKTIDGLFKSSLESFFGEVLVVKLKGSGWKKKNDVFVWEVTLNELKDGILQAQRSEQIPRKIIISVDQMPTLENGMHDPNYVLILSQESADYLVSNKDFNLYGTSWKSSDYNPGSRERPIHNTLFQKAAIFECLDLNSVPEGKYFFSGFPIPLEGASESPVCPVLFTKEELLGFVNLN